MGPASPFSRVSGTMAKRNPFLLRACLPASESAFLYCARVAAIGVRGWIFIRASTLGKGSWKVPPNVCVYFIMHSNRGRSHYPNHHHHTACTTGRGVRPHASSSITRNIYLIFFFFCGKGKGRCFFYFLFPAELIGSYHPPALCVCVCVWRIKYNPVWSRSNKRAAELRSRWQTAVGEKSWNAEKTYTARVRVWQIKTRRRKSFSIRVFRMRERKKGNFEYFSRFLYDN